MEDHGVTVRASRFEIESFRNDTKTWTFLKMLNYENAEQNINDKEAET